MAGTKTGDFKELVSPFLRRKMGELYERHGADDPSFLALVRQYIKNPLEDVVQPGERRRHYESEVLTEFEGKPVRGVERLYKTTALIEPTTVCAAHCRWCLRGQYPVTTLGEDDLTHSTRYIGSRDLRDEVSEILITGGDPVMSKPLLAFTLGEIKRNAPNVKVVRIGTRVLFQDPERINESLLSIFERYRADFRFELGVNVNHPVEFWPESIEAVRKLQDLGVRFYSQHPILKGVNDSIEVLVELYGLLREHDIEAHYLFHAIPLRGMSHHRTSLRRGIDLAAALNSCGEFSGRSKPKFAVLSDIGKIVLYDGVIVDRRTADNCVLLRSGFRYEDRMRWNPAWQKPESVEIDDNGFMLTWYQDGDDNRVGDEEGLLDGTSNIVRLVNTRR